MTSRGWTVSVETIPAVKPAIDSMSDGDSTLWSLMLEGDSRQLYCQLYNAQRGRKEGYERGQSELYRRIAS